MTENPRTWADAQRMAAVGQWSRTARTVCVAVLRNPWVALTAIGLIVVPVGLAIAGLLEIRLSEDGVHLNRPDVVGSGPGPRIAGGWRGEISDIQFGEFRRALSNQLELTLNRRGDTVWVEGHFLAGTATDGRYAPNATFAGVGTVSEGNFLSLPFDIKKDGVRGAGVLLLQIAPNGREADGYALYRRADPANGRMGLGRATFRRAD